MKRIIILLPGILFLLSRMTAQNNDAWVEFPGPYGGTFRNITQTQNGTLYVQPDKSFATTSGFSSRLYRSVDQGQHWTKLPLTLDGQFLNSYIDVGKSGTFNTLVFDSTNTLSTLYRSFDEGANWVAVKDSLPFRFVFETPGGTLLARTATATEIWRSADGGNTWNLVFNTLSTIPGDLRILQNGDLAWTGSTYEVYRSWDDGLGWQIVDKTTVQQAPLYITSAGTLLVPTWSNLNRSTDNGLTWQIIITTNYTLKTIVELASGRLLGIDASGEFHVSDDDGQTWSALSTDRSITNLLTLRLPDGTIFCYSNESLYRSADGGSTWQFSAEGMDLAKVMQMAFVSEDTLFAMTHNGLWRTDNSGTTWKKLTDNKATFPTWSNNLECRWFALGRKGRLAVAEDDSLYRSDNLGDHFSNITPPGGLANQPVALSPNDSFLFANAGQPDRIVRSDDFGLSWETSTLPSGNFFNLEFHPSGRIYGILYSSKTIWHSDDHGITWVAENGLPPAYSAVGLYADPGGNLFSIVNDGFNSFPLYRSNNNGANWWRHPAPAFSQYPGVFDRNTAGHLFLWNKVSNNYYRSLDEGVTWNAVPAPIFSSTYRPLVDPVSPGNHLYASCGLGMYRTQNPTTQGAYLFGSILRDADADCSTPDAQQPLYDWTVEAEGAHTFYGNTDVDGRYLLFVDTGAYNVNVQGPNDNWWMACGNGQDIVADEILGIDTLLFSAAAIVECPLISVDISIPLLRRCFDNNIYVGYCNQGTEVAYDARVDVVLDPYCSFVGSGLPAQDLGNNVFRFQVGDLAPGACGQFALTVHVDCDKTVLGQTHCFSAHGFPDTLCAAVQGWSGAEISASASCQDTVVQFELRNTGTGASQLLDYIIIVDDVVLMNGSGQYDPDEAITFSQPANGLTWRIESEQEPGHPFSNIALAFSEGCGGFNSLGFVAQYPVDEYLPSWDRDCVENTGSFDPNDKRGFPLGTKDEHFIRPGQELEYLIRFQNTGTDTAFTVVVRDTLSAWLDPASVHVGAASHPYTWELGGQGILTFTFNDILLPDSNVNEVASHGFVSFRIAQKPVVPIGTQIFNSAAIYFDFNPPVITNTTLHTVGVEYLTGTGTPVSGGINHPVRVSPNPVADVAVIEMEGGPFRQHRIAITDAAGLPVRSATVTGKQYLLHRNTLPAGLYFFRVTDSDGRPVDAGTFIIH